MAHGCTVVIRDGAISPASRKALADVMAELRAGPDRPIVIHFHGGLVSEKDAEVIADRLAPEYAAAGAFPVFVIWQTGLLETLRNNWTEAFTKEAFEAVLERVLQFLVGKLDQPPDAKGPSLQVQSPRQIRGEISKLDVGEEPFGAYRTDTSAAGWELNDAEKRQLFEAVAADAKVRTATDDLVRNGALDQFDPDLKADLAAAKDELTKGARGLLITVLAGVALKALMGALRRFSRGRGHGVYPTAVEEVAKAIFIPGLLGKFAWDAMKKDTRDAFEPGHEQFGGSALLHEINQTWEQGKHPRILLVGHSAGSIFVCEMLKAANKLAPGKFEIVLLAPACSFRLLDDTLTLAPNRISAFRCFAMSDDLERRDSLIKRVYPRSLLYFVSGVLESEADEPLVGMQRFHTRNKPFDDNSYPNIKRVIDGFQSHQNGWIWSVSSGGVGINTACETHGGFDDEKTTIESLKHFVRAGGATQ